MKLPPPVQGLRAAFVFLTRVPLGGTYVEEDWRWSTAHFPLVGFVLGCVMAAVWLVLRPAGDWVAAVGALAASLLITGAFHEDGLADTADALGGGYDREKVLAILKDSRIGTFGSAALIVSLVGRAAALVALGDHAVAALVLGQTLSRVPPIWLMAALPYATARDRARSRDVARSSSAQAAVATAWGALTAVAWSGVTPSGHSHPILGTFAGGWYVAMGVGALALVSVVCAWRFRVRVGGVTGDFLGATQQVGELVWLVTWAWLLGMGW